MRELRKLKTLVVVFLILLAFLVGVVVYQHIQNERINGELSMQNISLCELEDIRDFSVCTSEGGKTVFHFDDSHHLISAEHEGKDFSSDMLYASQIDTDMFRMLSFSVVKKIEMPSDLGSYGLDSNCSVISFCTKDGSSQEIRIGSLLPNKSGVYLQINGQDEVVIADYSYYQAIHTSFEKYLNMNVLMLDRSDILKIDFDRTSNGDHWSMKPLEDYDNGVFLEPRYMVMEPIEREPTDQLIQLFEQILKLQVSEYISIDESEYAAYGLDQPEYHFLIFKTNGECIDLYFSMELAGYFYGYSSNMPYVFRVQSQSLSGIDLSPFELCEAYVRQEYFEDIKSCRVTIKDEEFSMQFSFGNSQSFQSDDVKLSLNQRNAKVYSSDGHCYGLVLFDSIFWMPISDVENEANPDASQAEATIFVTKVNSEIYSIKLVPKDEDSYYCMIDDRYTGYIVDRSVLYKDNGSNLENYGIWDAYVLANEAIDYQNSDKIYDRP